MKKSKEATLGALYHAIPNDMAKVKEFVQAKIRTEAKFWNDLDEDSQNVVMQTDIQFLGRIYSLSKLRDMIKTEKFNEIFCQPEMKDWFMKAFRKEELDFGHYEIPEALPYYIRRKLTLKRKLNPLIFKHKCSDIFLIEGIQHHHLSILARPELTDVSSEQLTKVTRRFILLEHPDDYDEIVKIANHPVHRIKHDDNQFFWLSTEGSCKIIRIFLTNEVEEIDEATLIREHLSIFNNRPIVICSSPGMGKSVLLANLAHEIIHAYKQRIVLFLQVGFLISKLLSTGLKSSMENIKQILVQSPSISSIGQKVLLEFLNSKDFIFEVFLDGFDEISLDHLQLAKEFFRCLFDCPNMRIYITSRPHMRSEIENTFEVISLDIAPFDDENQRNFLCNFWILDQNITQSEKLSRIALTVLESLEFINDSNNSQAKFAGNPLQCFILAQVYAKDAKRSANRDRFNFQVTKSLFELYTQFFNFRLKDIPERDKNFVKIHHWKEALKLLFPSNQVATQIIQNLSNKVGKEDVPLNTIYKVGIIEEALDKPSFVHRTFAEYLIAEFLATELVINQTVGVTDSKKFIIDSVLNLHKTTRRQIISLADVNQTARYIESSQTKSNCRLNLKSLKSILISNSNLSMDIVRDDLSAILGFWVVQMGSTATIDRLLTALNFVGCNNIADDLHQNFLKGNRVLQHEIVCNFVEDALGENDSKLAVAKINRCQYDSTHLSHKLDKLEKKLLICAEHGYQFFTQLLMAVYRDAANFQDVMELKSGVCKEIIIKASQNDNVEFFKYTCDAAKSLGEFNLNDCLKKFNLKDLKFESTPLFESIKRGNYKLVEYLLMYIGDDVKESNDLWLSCFIDSEKDSPNVIKNKVKILRLLNYSHQNFQIEALEQNFPCGVNVVLLTELYDLSDYSPTEKDSQFIIMSTANFCRLDSEIDFLVNWFLSRNLAHILVYQGSTNRCIISETLLRNVLRPETLSLVYTAYRFDLSILYQSIGLCKRNEAIVETIVKLSGNVNLVDDYKNTLLHCAAFFRMPRVISYLLSVGADVHLKNAFGDTPLHKVFPNEIPETFHLVYDSVNLLVANNVLVGARNICGLSALDIAKAYQDEMLIEEKTLVLLESKSSNSDNSVAISLDISEDPIEGVTRFNSDECHMAYFSGWLFPWVWNLVQTLNNVDLSDSHNTSLLHYAALFGELKTMKYLLSKGANGNVTDIDGDTPLHYIFNWKWREANGFNSLNTKTWWIYGCVELILKHYVNVDVKNNQGETPQDLARKQRKNLKIEDRTMVLLVERFQLENEVD